MFCPWIRLITGFALPSIFLSGTLTAFAAGADQPDAPHFASDAAALYQRASRVSPPAGTDVLVLEDDETLIFSADGKVFGTRYLLYKVLTQKGAEDWADLLLQEPGTLARGATRPESQGDHFRQVVHALSIPPRLPTRPPGRTQRQHLQRSPSDAGPAPCRRTRVAGRRRNSFHRERTSFWRGHCRAFLFRRFRAGATHSFDTGRPRNTSAALRHPLAS